MDEKLARELNENLKKLLGGSPTNKDNTREAERQRLYDKMDRSKLKRHLKNN